MEDMFYIGKYRLVTEKAALNKKRNEQIVDKNNLMWENK